MTNCCNLLDFQKKNRHQSTKKFQNTSVNSQHKFRKILIYLRNNARKALKLKLKEFQPVLMLAKEGKLSNLAL